MKQLSIILVLTLIAVILAIVLVAKKDIKASEQFAFSQQEVEAMCHKEAALLAATPIVGQAPNAYQRAYDACVKTANEYTVLPSAYISAP